MPGGIPSGADPTGWEAATPGSTPAAGYDPTVLPGAVVGTSSPPTISNQLTGVSAGLSNLVNRTQSAVTAAYQELVQGNSSLTSASSQIFEGLVNVNGTTPLTTLLLVSLAQSLGIDISQLTTSSATLSAIQTAWSAVESNASKAWAALESFVETGNFSSLEAAFTDIGAALFGSSTSPGLLGSIPSSWITNTTVNAQPVSTFPNAASMQVGGGWSYDGTVDHTGVAGSGSALFTASGVAGYMDGTPLAVQADQVVYPEAYVQWSGLTAASGTSPVQLQLQPGTLNAAGDFVAVGSVEVIAELTSPAASGSWTALTGSYTVASGITAVQVTMMVTADATAGSIWWDDCTTSISGGWLSALEADFQDILGAFGAGGTAAEFVTGISGLLQLLGLSSVTTAFTSAQISSIWTTVITDFINPLNQIKTTVDNIVGTIEVDASNIIGTIEQDAVSGLSTIATDVGDAVSWLTRLVSDISILLDVFHLTYQPGSAGDAPGTLGTNGKPTWYSAWNDLLELLGIVNSTAAPTIPAPTIGTSAIPSSALGTISIGGVSDTIENQLQAIVDAHANALGVSTTTGNPISSITTGLTAIPASNVVGIAPAAVAFGAVGGSATGEGSVSSGIATASEYHAIAAGDTGMVVALGWTTGIPTGTILPSTVTFGGQEMTLLGSVSTAPSGYVSSYLQLWWLKSPPSGSQEVLASINLASMASDSGLLEVWLASGSYSASATGTASSISGTGAALSISVGSAADHMAVAAFISTGEYAADSISGFTQTQRYNASQETGADTGFVFGDAPGNAAGVTFGATGGGSTSHWAGIVVDLSN